MLWMLTPMSQSGSFLILDEGSSIYVAWRLYTLGPINVEVSCSRITRRHARIARFLVYKSCPLHLIGCYIRPPIDGPKTPTDNAPLNLVPSNMKELALTVASTNAIRGQGLQQPILFTHNACFKSVHKHIRRFSVQCSQCSWNCMTSNLYDMNFLTCVYFHFHETSWQES